MAAGLTIAAAQSAGPRVELNLIVTDKDDKPLNAIRKEEVHVFEGKIEQTILSVEPDNRPIDFVLAIDTSGSFRRWFEGALKAASMIVRDARPEDEIFIERFISSDKIETVKDFSRDTKALLKAVDSLYIEGGQSAIIDALYLATDALTKHNQGERSRRKVIVVITDGEERNSFYKAEKLVNFQRTNDVQVFALGLTSDLKTTAAANQLSARERAEKLLKIVTEESGGRAFLAKNQDDLLLNAVPELLSQLRQQFVLSYQSSDTSSTKGFRLVELKLDSPNGEKRTAIAPHAYYFPPLDTPSQKREKSPQ
jgi:Ca-activated chloride channel family protein